MIFSLLDIIFTESVKGVSIFYVDNGVIETSLLSVIYRPVFDEDMQPVSLITFDFLFLSGLITTVKQTMNYFKKDKNIGE